MADQTSGERRGKGESEQRSRGGCFTVVADHPRNCDVIVQAITNCRLRSAIKSSRTVKDAKTGAERVPIDQAHGLGKYPEIPGMELYIDTRQGKFVIRDPLYDNKDLCAQILAARNQSALRSNAELRGAQPREGKLDQHVMKTLCREVAHMISNGHVKVLSGVAPTVEECDDLPGRYVNNIGSQVPNTQPRYEDQMDEWLEGISRVGA